MKILKDQLIVMNNLVAQYPKFSGMNSTNYELSSNVSGKNKSE